MAKNSIIIIIIIINDDLYTAVSYIRCTARAVDYTPYVARLFIGVDGLPWWSPIQVLATNYCVCSACVCVCTALVRYLISRPILVTTTSYRRGHYMA